MLSRAYTPSNSICMPAKVAFLGPLLLTPSTPLHLIGGTPLYLHACNPGISLRPYDYLLFTVGVTPALIRAHLLWHIYVSPQNDPCNPRDLGPMRHLIKVTRRHDMVRKKSKYQQRNQTLLNFLRPFFLAS